MIPDLDEANKTVGLRLLLVPGNKMRVRYIHFSGNEKTKDNVLRREMRQLEGAMYQASKVDRSKIRLQRLNFIGSVTVGLQKVANSVDEVDLEVEVTERFSGNLQIGLGFSQVQGAILNLGFTHENIFGTGNKLDFQFNNSAASEQYALSYEDPYYTEEGVSRGFNGRVTKTDAGENNTSNYLIDQASFSVDYGIPLSEYNRLRLEVGVLRNDLRSTSDSSDEVLDFLRDTSDKYNDSTPDSDVNSEVYDTVFTGVSFTKDSRNRKVFANSGSLNSIGLEVDAGDLEFYKIRYRHQTAFALSEMFTLSLRGKAGYGGSYGDADELPIFEKYYAGGVRSVRGYETNSLGPLDSEGDPLGGDLQVITTAEVIFPIEALGSSDTFRLGVYFDVGNVFEDFDTYDSGELRQSTGVSAKWFSFIGPIEFSYAFPLNDEPEDDIQNFQFSLGATF